MLPYINNGAELNYFLITKSMEFDATSHIEQQNKQYLTGTKGDIITVISNKGKITFEPKEGTVIQPTCSDPLTENTFSFSEEGNSFSFAIITDHTKDGIFEPSAHIKVEIDESSILSTSFSGYFPAENKGSLNAANLEANQLEKPNDYRVTKPEPQPEPQPESTPEADDPDNTTTIIIVVVVVVVVVIVVVVLLYFLVFRKKSDAEPEKQNIDNDEENGEQLKKDDVFLGEEKKDEAPAADANKDEFAL